MNQMYMHERVFMHREINRIYDRSRTHHSPGARFVDKKFAEHANILMTIIGIKIPPRNLSDSRDEELFLDAPLRS